MFFVKADKKRLQKKIRRTITDMYTHLMVTSVRGLHEI